MKPEKLSIDYLQSQWEADSKIDRSELAQEALKTPMLHAKYMELFNRVRVLLFAAQKEKAKEVLTRDRYYAGKLSMDELRAENLEPFQLKVLRGDVGKYLDADEQLTKCDSKILQYEIMRDYLIEVIKQINKRDYLIKGAVEFIRWTHGNID